jgi:hypothetical protein
MITVSAKAKKQNAPASERTLSYGKLAYWQIACALAPSKLRHTPLYDISHSPAPWSRHGAGVPLILHVPPKLTLTHLRFKYRILVG